MRIGVIMPVAIPHAHQPECWEQMRRFSRPETPIYVLFNGIAPMPLCEGVQTLHVADPFSDEADLWDYCLGFAWLNGWDWCVIVHDDFQPREAGWEAELELAEGWRVIIAAWCAYAQWDDSATTSCPAEHHLAVAVDSFAWALKVQPFVERGFVCGVRWKFGYGAWEPNAWALRQGYGVWRIQKDAWHQWRMNENTRSLLHVGAIGHPESKALFADVLPAFVVDDAHISVHGRVIRIAPEDAANA